MTPEQQRIDELTQQLNAANDRIKRLEEVRGNVSKETIQSDSSIWAKAGIGFTTEAKQ